MEMSWTYLFGMDGVAMNLLKPVYMQLCFFLEELYAYITVVGSWMKPFITVFAFMHQVAYVAGWIFYHRACNLSFVQDGLWERGHRFYTRPSIRLTRRSFAVYASSAIDLVRRTSDQISGTGRKGRDSMT